MKGAVRGGGTNDQTIAPIVQRYIFIRELGIDPDTLPVRTADAFAVLLNEELRKRQEDLEKAK